MRIVSLFPAATEIVCALGAGEQLVGVSEECDYPTWVRNLPVLVRSQRSFEGLSSGEIDFAVREQARAALPSYVVDEQQLAALAPDVVLTQGLCDVCAVGGATLSDALESLGGGAQIVALSSGTIAGIHRDFQLVGDAIGRGDVAKALIRSQQERFVAVVKAVAYRHRPRVVLLEWTDPLYACGHWVPEMIDLAGGNEIIGVPGAHSQSICFERLATADPDVILVAPCGFSLERARAEATTLIASSEWQDLRAARAGRVFAIDANSYVTRPGPRIVAGVVVIAQILHGIPDPTPTQPFFGLPASRESHSATTS